MFVTVCALVLLEFKELLQRTGKIKAHHVQETPKLTLIQEKENILPNVEPPLSVENYQKTLVQYPLYLMSTINLSVSVIPG